MVQSQSETDDAVESNKCKDAEELRLQGNKCFVEKRYFNAIKCYTNSVRAFVTMSAVLNRAQAYLNVNQYESALADANRALEMDPNCVKALFRRAKATAKMGLFDVAFEDLTNLLILDVNNTDALKLKQEIAGKKNLENVRVRYGRSKCEAIQSRMPLARVAKIEFVPRPCSLEESVSNTKEPLAVKFEPPKSIIQLNIDRKLMKDSPVKFAEYFLQISVHEYRSVIDEFLDADLIIMLIHGYKEILCMSNASQIIESLLALSSVSRFEIAVAFLSSSEKNDLRELVVSASRSGNLETIICELYKL